MDGAIYQKWIEDIDALSEAQREEVQKILAGRSSEDALPRPAVCDIVVVVLWARMGTPLPENVRKAEGRGRLDCGAPARCLGPASRRGSDVCDP